MKMIEVVEMKAVILAGGKGTRLGSLTHEIPKPMIMVGDKPILGHQIELLKEYGITDITIITHYLSGVIEDYFGNGKKFGVDISYFREEEPLGTCGGIKEIEGNLTQDFLILYGDVMLNMDLGRLISFHQGKKSACTLVLHPNDHPYDSDLVEVNPENRITAFHSKPHEKGRYFRNLANAAVYIMSPKILKYLGKGKKADLAKDLFPSLVDKEPLYGYITAEYQKDVGTPERLEEVNKDFASGKMARLNMKNKRPAIFMDRDGVINKEVNYLNKIEQLEILPGAIMSVKKINRSDFLAIVITNQPVIARNMCSVAELDEIHRKLETLLAEDKAKLDAIYYCPHHPDKGYPEERAEYKIDCGCRKPKIGLVKTAEEKFNIDLKNSFFVGDADRDILCGKNAGMKTIAVGGFRGKEKPDYAFKNLGEAVDFILESSR
ncbi:MAG: HAD-IIIA family hydrolase [Candidatus Diapherotrites archaeon]